MSIRLRPADEQGWDKSKRKKGTKRQRVIRKKERKNKVKVEME